MNNKFINVTTYIAEEGYKADASGLLTKSHWKEVDTLINLNQILWFAGVDASVPVGNSYALFIDKMTKLSFKESLKEIQKLIAGSEPLPPPGRFVPEEITAKRTRKAKQ